MKTITNDYKEQIAKLGRQIDFKFFLHTNDKLITEDGKFIITQDNLNLIVEQLDDEEIDYTIESEDIYNVAIVNKGNILSTMMKEIDFEVKQDLRVGDIIDCSFGLKVNNAYEYINFGRYVINTKEHNEDTDTYSYTAFDGMMLSMITADDLSIVQNKTIQEAIENICEKVGLSVNITEQDIDDYPNLLKITNSSVFDNMEMTYRDILDAICQCLGLSMITDNKTLLLKPINRTPVDTFDEFYLKDTNVKFGEKYGPINSVVLSRSEDTDSIYRRDEQSIALNGLHEFKIKDNLIMLYDDREDYIDEIFEQLNGLEFYENDFTSTGITYLDWLDTYNITIGNKTYGCLMLNDEIKISQGLEETIYAEKPKETTTQYKTSSKTDKEVSFIVDKQKGEIKAKVSKGDVINEINLDESGASINAEKISLEGKEINLTSDDINITSTKFTVDQSGNMTCCNANITGGQLQVGSNFSVDQSGNMTANNVTLNSGVFKGELNTSQNCKVGDNLYVGQNQSSSADNIKYLYMATDGYIRRWTIGGKSYMRMNADYQLNLTTDSTYIYLFGDGYNGITMSTTPSYGSDARLKDNIKETNVDWIDDLKLKQFNYKNSPKIKEIGLVAQDYLDKDYKDNFITTYDNNGEEYYSIKYQNITNGLIQYCQELKQQVKELEKRVNDLEKGHKGDDE